MIELASRHALALLVALGAVLRFATLGTQGFWLDEHVTLEVIRLGPVDLLRAVVGGESNPALYYLLAGGWERVFGDSELGVRSLSALLGTATIPVVYACASHVASRRAGLIAAAIAATSPLLVWYSQEARNYELLVFLSALGLLFFLRALDDGDGRWLWGWALTSALALGTHYFAIAAIAPQLGWLVARRTGRRGETALAGAVVGAVGLALLPLLAMQRGRGSWIADYSLSDRLLQVPEHFVVGLQVPWEAIPALALALAAAAAVYGTLCAGPRERTAIAIAGSVAAAGVALTLVAGAAGDDYLTSRNLLELWPAFAVALAVALAAPGARRIGIAAAGALCLAGVGLTMWTAATPAAQRPDYTPLARALALEGGERLIVSQTSFSSPLTIYLEGSRTATDDDLVASELVIVEPRPTEDYSVGTCWWLSSCGNVDLDPPPRFEVPPEFELRRSGSAGSFDYRVYTAPRPTPIVRPVEYYTPRVFVQGG